MHHKRNHRLGQIKIAKRKFVTVGMGNRRKVLNAKTPSIINEVGPDVNMLDPNIYFYIFN